MDQSDCRPSFYLVTWTRDNASLFSLTADPTSGLRIDGKTGWLEFSEVTEEAGGEYRCQAYNRMGSSGLSALHDIILFDILKSGKYFISPLTYFPRALLQKYFLIRSIKSNRSSCPR